MTMQTIDRTGLAFFASKYIWWKSVDEALSQPERVVAQIMNIGDFDDIQNLETLLGAEVLAHVLIHAEIGQFTPRSWSYWHYRLGLSDVDEVPPLPVRRLA